MPRLPKEKTKRQDMIKIARAGIESGLKKNRIAANLGITRFQLRRLLNNK